MSGPKPELIHHKNIVPSLGFRVFCPSRHYLVHVALFRVVKHMVVVLVQRPAPLAHRLKKMGSNLPSDMQSWRVM